MNIEGSQQARVTHTIRSPEHTVIDKIVGSLKMKLGLALPPWALNHSPTWSPDGSHIAFTSNHEGYNGIYILDIENGQQTLLTKTETDAITISWSPDGSKIVFDSLNGLTIMDLDGSNVQLLGRGIYYDADPDWSPDGTKITFRSSGRHEQTGLLQTVEIYTMNVDGSEATRLTHDNALSLEPVWSPDGQRIAYYSNKEGNFDIYIMNADGSEQRRLTSHPSEDMSPTWSPDGDKIAFVSGRNGNYEIYTMEIDSTEITRITFNPAFDEEPDWRP